MALRPSITAWPIMSAVTSSPRVSSCLWIPEISRSIRAWSMSRLRQAWPIARSSLARSNGSRLPSFLTTVRSRSWTRSKVVKRAPQPSHCRRRRIAAPSSDGRLSLTWLSSCAQNGQRISLCPKAVPAHSPTRPPIEDRLTGRPGGGVGWCRARECASIVLVDREARAELADAARDRLLDLRVAGFAVLAQALDDLGDQPADCGELGLAKAAGRSRRRAEADARSDERLFGIERNAVLVASDPGPVERLFRMLALGLLGPQVDQHQMVVGAAR